VDGGADGQASLASMFLACRFERKLKLRLPQRVGALVTAIVLPSFNQLRGVPFASHSTSEAGSSNTSIQRVSKGTVNCAGVQYGAAYRFGSASRVSGAVQVPRVYWWAIRL